MGLRERTVQGMVWTSLSFGGRFVLQLAVTAVLARLLEPREFGLVAAPGLIINFLLIFRGAGLGAAIAQREKITEDHLNAVFWYSAASGLGLALLVVALAPVVGFLFNEPRVVPIVALTSVTVILNSLAAGQSAVLTRALQFKRLAGRELLGQTVGGGVGIAMAFSGYGAYSLVGQGIAGAALGLVFLWVATPWRPRWSFRMNSLRDLWGFGANVTGFQVFNFFNRNLDRFLLARFVSFETIALYDRGSQILRMPLQVIHRVVGRVLFVALARVRDVGRAREAYLESTRMLTGLLYLPLVGAVVLAEPLVGLLFGPMWGRSVPVLQLFAIAGFHQVLTTTQGWIYKSRGRPDLQMRIAILYAPISMGAVIVGLQWGLMGVAIAYTAGTYGVTALWWVAFRLLELKIVELLRNLAGVFLATAMAGAWLWMADTTTTHFITDANLLRLAVGAIIGSAIYLLTIFIVDRRLLSELRTLLTQMRGGEPISLEEAVPPRADSKT